MKQKGFIGPIFLYIIGIIIILVLVIMFAAKPLKVYSENATPPFKPKQLILAEKITYLFNKPNIGDRVIFIPQNTETTYVGIITNSENQGDITSYTIISAANKNPWKVSADKITGKIYYPFLDPAETAKLAQSLQSAPIPSPSPEPTSPNLSTTPTNIASNSADETANWKTYINTQLGISFKYPNNWLTKSKDIASTYLHGVVALDPEEQEPQGPIPSTISVSYWDNPDQLSLKDLDQKYSSGMGSPGLYSPIPQKIVGPVGPALHQANANCEPVLCDRILIPYKDKVYALTEYYNSVDDPNRESQKEVLNQILSTFKFLP